MIIRKLKTFMKNPVGAYKNFMAQLIMKMKFLDDKTYIKLQYLNEMNRLPNLKNPKRFSEKMNWVKLYGRKKEYNMMVDKYEVRKYVAEKIGEEYLIPLLGVWDSWDEIDFDALPDEFVIKCTHDSGSVIVCKDKSTFDFEKAKEKINRKLNQSLYDFAREWPYKDLKPRIIAEKFMKEADGSGLKDYKFFCFNGEPTYLYISENLHDHAIATIDFYDIELNNTPFKRTDFKTSNKKIVPPPNYDKMVEFARIFSKDIPHLRVDFYDINGEIYFGELTFFTSAGYLKLDPEEWDLKLGEMMDISDMK